MVFSDHTLFTLQGGVVPAKNCMNIIALMIFTFNINEYQLAHDKSLFQVERSGVWTYMDFCVCVIITVS